MGRVVDLTAYKLEKMLDANSSDAWVHETLLDILADYYLGQIAIGWRDGQPVVMQLDAADTWNRGIPPGFSIVSLDSDLVHDRDEDKDDKGEDDA